jgi:hypothetical protein
MPNARTDYRKIGGLRVVLGAQQGPAGGQALGDRGAGRVAVHLAEGDDRLGGSREHGLLGGSAQPDGARRG